MWRCSLGASLEMDFFHYCGVKYCWTRAYLYFAFLTEPIFFMICLRKNKLQKKLIVEKIHMLLKNRNFWENLKFLWKIKMLVISQNFGQKLKFLISPKSWVFTKIGGFIKKWISYEFFFNLRWTITILVKMEILLKSRNFYKKNLNFLEILAKNQNFSENSHFL